MGFCEEDNVGVGLIGGREVGLGRMGLISRKPKQWAKEGSGGFEDET